MVQIASARRVTDRVARAHVDRLTRLPGWGFILAVGLWTAVLKTILVPIVAVLNSLVLAPLGLATIFGHGPLEELADSLTKMVYDVPFLGWDTLSVLSRLLVVALLFPILATFLAQVVPLHVLARWIPRQTWRAATAMVVMGTLYMLAYGQVAFLVSGGIVAVPLVCAFLHRLRAASLRDAFLVTCAAHALANATVVLFRGLFGDM